MIRFAHLRPRRTAPLLMVWAASMAIGAATPRASHADVVPVADAKFTELAESFGGADFKVDEPAPGIASSSDDSDPDAPVPFSVHVSATTMTSPTLSGLTARASGAGANDGGHAEGKVDFSLEAAEIAPPPVPVEFIPVEVSGTLTVSADAHGGGPSGQTINASSSASFFLNQAESLSMGCDSSSSQCDVFKQDGLTSSQSQVTNGDTVTFNFSFETDLSPNQVATGFIDAGIVLGLVNGELEDGTALNTLATAISDPMIEIDPSFAFKDDFQLVFSNNLFTPTNAVPEPSTWLLTFTGLGLLAILGQVRSRGSQRIRRSMSEPVRLRAARHV
jgi:hypothetical protein